MAKEPVLKTGARKRMWVRVPPPPFFFPLCGVSAETYSSTDGQVEPTQPESEALGAGPCGCNSRCSLISAQSASIRVQLPPLLQHLGGYRAGLSGRQELVPRRHPEPIPSIPGRLASNLILYSGRVFRLEPMG